MAATRYRQIASLKPTASDDSNRITVEWVGPDGITRIYAINQRTLKKYATAEAAKTALDTWTQKSFGYVLDDLWLHINRDGTWAVATGVTPPATWPEDEPAENYL